MSIGMVGTVMEHRVEWQIEQRVIVVKINGDFRIEEIDPTNQRIRALLEAGTPPVHYIVDITDMGKFSPQVHRYRPASSVNHPNTGWFLLVGGNHLARFMSRVLAAMIRGKFHSSDSMQEALEFLCNQDSTLTVPLN